MSRRMDWSRARARHTTPKWDIGHERRAHFMRLGLQTVLSRARGIFLQARSRNHKNPFCQRCTKALKERRIGGLCDKCIYVLTYTKAPAYP